VSTTRAPATTAGGTGTRPPGSRPSGWAATALWLAPIALAAATMLVLGLWGLARHNAMGNDEIVTRYASMLSFGQLAHLLKHTDVYHGFYYVLMHGWVVLGTTPVIIRVPSVIAMTVAVGLLVYVARRLSGSAWTGLFAGLIMALTPVISFYAQTAREYATIIVVVLCATLALVRAIEAEMADAARERIRVRWLVYAPLITVCGYLNEITLVVLAAHAVTLLLARPGRRAMVHWAAAGAVGAVLVLPVVALSLRQDSAASWITRPTVHDLGTLFHDYFGSQNIVGAAVLLCALVAVLPAGKSEPPWWRRSGITLPSVAAPLLVMPVGVVLLESVVAHPVYVDRYVLFGEAGAAMLAGAGLYRIGQWLADVSRQRALVAVTGAAVCLGVLVLQLGPQQRARTPESRLFDYGDPAFYIGAHARPGDGVLFFNWFFRKIRLGYPEDFRNTTDFGMAISPQQSGTLNGFDKPSDVVRRLMLGYQRIWVVGRQPSDDVAAPAVKAEGELLMRRYKLITERHYKSITVTLWQQHGAS
jgi:mannosyltransferase